MSEWLSAFVFTQLVEAPLYVATLAGARPERPRLGVTIALALGASAITHPFVWFAFPMLALPWVGMVACAEAFAVVVEALYLRRLGLSGPRAWLTSLVANAASLSLGLASRARFGWP